MTGRTGILLLLMLAGNAAFSQPFLLKPATDSVVQPASRRYSNPTFLTRVLLGDNYREVWAQPVKAPVLRLSETEFKILKMGGGQQTLSLRLEDREGKEWVLRTLDKDITKLRLPSILPKKLFLPMMQDQISAGFPYSHSTVYELARAAGIVAAKPFLYWVADDPGLKEYRTVMSNRYCILERREPTPDNSDTKSTETVLENIYEENTNLLLQKKVLKARLLDMLVGDWDRHADQWRWDKVDSGKINYYYAIPRDRDQAFFYSDGILTKVTQWIGFKQLIGFKEDLHIKKINWKSWPFDRTFLNQLDEGQWEASIKEFQALMSDTVIINAVKQMPSEVFQMQGAAFIEKLKERRNELLEEGMKYYRHISKVVVINGTEENELFSFHTTGGILHLRVTEAGSGRIVFARSFDPAVTWKILVNGRGGKDRFELPSSAESKLRVEINGGPGDDSYEVKGRVRTLIIDDRSSGNQFDLGGKARRKARG